MNARFERAIYKFAHIPERKQLKIPKNVYRIRKLTPKRILSYIYY